MKSQEKTRNAGSGREKSGADRKSQERTREAGADRKGQERTRNAGGGREESGADEKWLETGFGMDVNKWVRISE